jgi:uncharacterized membrane protein YphA (DoxX/SURF4 family)
MALSGPAPRTDAGLLVLRLGVGTLLLFHGVYKITHGVAWIAGPLSGAGLPAWLQYGAYVGEVLAPALVILSRLFGYTPLTLVFTPMLIAAVAIAVLVTAFITFDGESNWGEGVSLLALYAIIATSFWWG